MKQHVIVLMDISYSMQPHAKNMIDGLNKFVDTLRARSDHTNILFSAMLFSDKRSYLCREVPVDDLSPFTVYNIPEFGLTHLYDAIGELFDEWTNETREQHHLFIITDGDDNGSKKVTKQQATQMCDKMVLERNWTVTHCDVDINKLGSFNVQKVVYDIDNLEELLGNLSI